MTTFCHAKNAPLVPKVQNTGCGPILGCEWFPDTGHDKKKGAFLAPGHRIHRGKPSLERHAGVWQSIDVVVELGAYHVYVEAEYYYVKDVTNAAGPWLASSNQLTFEDDSDLTLWTNIMYNRSKECYALNRPINITPELLATLSTVESTLVQQLYDCETYSVVEGLP